MAPTLQYAHLFQEGEDHYYLYARELARGRSLTAQIVLDVKDGVYKVRKVPHPDSRSSDWQQTDQVHLEKEVAVYQLFNVNLGATAPPFIAELTGHDTSASYWRFYNGEDLKRYISSEEDRSTDESSPSSSGSGGSTEKVIPLPVVARFTHQILTALAHLYRYRVIHSDLSDENIFLQFEPGRDAKPDFYLADFGHSRYVPTNEEAANDIIRLIARIKEMIASGRGLELPEADEEYDDEDIENLLRTVQHGPYFWSIIERLKDLNDTFPDLSAFIADAREAERRFDASHRAAGKPVGTPYSERVAYLAESGNEVKYYKTKQQLRAQNVVGPWYEAEVDVGNNQVVSIGNEPVDQA